MAETLLLGSPGDPDDGRRGRRDDQEFWDIIEQNDIKLPEVDQAYDQMTLLIEEAREKGLSDEEIDTLVYDWIDASNITPYDLDEGEIL